MNVSECESTGKSGPPPPTTQGCHATARFLEGFLEGSLKDVLLRRVLRRRLGGVSKETEVLRRVLTRGGGVIEGAWKALRRQTHALSQSTTPFACTLLAFSSVFVRNIGISLLLLWKPHSKWV